MKSTDTKESRGSKFDLNRVFSVRGYQIIVDQEEKVTDSFMDAILDQSYVILEVFKDDRSTYAAKIQIGEDTLVYKIPKGRLRRLGERVVTLVRDCESIRVFKSLQLIRQLGFEAPRPLMAGYMRRKGFVTESFCCYRFEEGCVAKVGDLADVVSELLELHKKGYLRSDAKLENFLITQEGVSFIDIKLKKPLFCPRFKKAMELAYLNRVSPESVTYFPKEIRESRSFVFACWLERTCFEANLTRRRIKMLFRSKQT